jgi:hypothetical protein
MGISKQMQMEEMHRVSVLEYDEDDIDAAWCAKENYENRLLRKRVKMT